MHKGKSETIKGNKKNVIASECNCDECLNDARNMLKKNVVDQLNMLMPCESKGIVQEMLLSLKKGDEETINAYTSLLKTFLAS